MKHFNKVLYTFIHVNMCFRDPAQSLKWVITISASAQNTQYRQPHIKRLYMHFDDFTGETKNCLLNVYVT